MSRLLIRSSRRRAARASEHRVLPLALPRIARSRSAPPPRRAKVSPLRSRSRRRAASHLSEHPALQLALALIGRAPFAPAQRGAKVLQLRAHSSRRPAAPLSEHPALPFSLKACARAPFALLSGRFLARETMASFAWNIRDLHCYSVCFAAPENSHLVRNLVRVVFAFRAAAKNKRREVAAHECFNLAGPTGLEPATSGVTGRRSTCRVVNVTRPARQASSRSRCSDSRGSCSDEPRYTPLCSAAPARESR